MNDKICLLFTKKFPYGTMESYISNELPYLSKTFDSVYIVPYHEFSFDETSNRVAHLPFENLFVLKPNALPRYSPMQRVERFFDTLRILALEMVLTNQKAATFQKLKTLFFRIKHYHAIAKKLSLFVSKDNSISKQAQFYCYHYWNHDGVIIEKLMQSRFQFRPQKSIARAHSIDLFHNDWPKGFVAFEKLKLKYLNNIFAISQLGLNYLRRKFPLQSPKFELAYLGVPDMFKGHTQFPSEKFTILTVSNIAEIKRLHLMIDIMKCLPNQQFEWVHIGDGVSKYSEPLKEGAKNSGIDFKFLGHLDSNQIHQYYQENEVLCFINLSYMEGVPVSIMESLMHGIPCIATDVGGTSELVEDNQNGYLIATDFLPSDVAQKILDLSNHPAQWNLFSEKAREKYLAGFNSDNNYAEFFKKLIA